MRRVASAPISQGESAPTSRIWRFLLAPYVAAASSPEDQLLFRRITVVVLIAVTAAITNATVDSLRGAIAVQSYWVLISGLAGPWVAAWRLPQRLHELVQFGFGCALAALVYGVIGGALIGYASMLGMAYASSIPIVAAYAVSARCALIWMWTVLATTLVSGAGAILLTPAMNASNGTLANTTVTVLLLTAISSSFAIAGRRQNDAQHARLAEMNASLEATVAQRTNELATALNAAQAASKAKGAFVANMSHELRTPLNGVLGVTDLLGDTPLDAEQRGLLESLEVSGRALRDSLGSILDFATIESGGIELTDHPFDPAEVVYRAVTEFAPAVQAKGVDLAVACAPDLPDTVNGDALQLGRAIERLVSNAVKFTVVGQIGVFCWFESGGAGGPGTICIEVQDSGPGIDRESLDHLWDAFAPGDDSSQKAHAGIGLGLTLVHEFARLSGGQVDVRSTVGVGTAFTLRVPAAGTAGTAQLLPVTPGRIGVIAGPLSRWSLAYVLVSHGADAEPIQASSSVAAYDAVIVDRSSPDGGTWTVPDGLRCIELGGAHGLASPVRPEALMFALAALPLPPQTAAVTCPAPATEASIAIADAAEPSTADGAAPARSRATVLIVEDNPVNRKVLTKMVATLGYETLCAENGQDGADAYAANTDAIVAVLMDCQMPVLDGFGATRVIRAAEDGGRRCPIIAVTANALEGDREKCLAAGMDEFVAKPVDRARLAAVLHDWSPLATTPAAV